MAKKKVSNEVKTDSELSINSFTDASGSTYTLSQGGKKIGDINVPKEQEVDDDTIINFFNEYLQKEGGYDVHNFSKSE